MKIALLANTAGQLYFTKNIIRRLKDQGHGIKLLVRDYGDTLTVANEIGMEYFLYSKASGSKIGKIISLPGDILKAYEHLREFKPDILVGFGVYDAFVSFMLNRPCVYFEDSEPRVNTLSYAIQVKASALLVDTIITPEYFSDELGKKQIRVKSFKEMAYLHPDYFKPDENIFNLLGLHNKEDFIILRFNAFDAVHDFSIKGFSDEDKIRLVKELEKYASVFISSEAGIPDELNRYVVKIPKSRIHDAIYYAKLLVTDTQTMATEGAILGTPTIRCNTFVGDNDMGNFIEFEQRYNLIFNYNDPDKAIIKAVELIQKQNLKEEWKIKKERLLKDKIDINTFMIWLLENYPESFEEIKANPDIQNKFK